jgi:hypothetical protein
VIDPLPTPEHPTPWEAVQLEGAGWMVIDADGEIVAGDFTDECTARWIAAAPECVVACAAARSDLDHPRLTALRPLTQSFLRNAAAKAAGKSEAPHA